MTLPHLPLARLPLPRLPLAGLRDWMFAIKTFVGAMLAMWLAMRLNLDRPYWAMATAYIVAQPLAGAMRSKAMYRFGGTLIGSIVTIVLIPNLVNTPALLVGALSLWVGGCIYFAVLDRTARSYLFLLAGYTVAIIGFPSVDAPGTIWDTSLARLEEITIGIVCSTVIGSIVFPAPLGPALAARLNEWTANAAALAIAVLSDRDEEARLPAARRRVAGDAVEIGLLASHLSYDTSNLQSATRPVAMLRQHVLLLLPVISGIDDRLKALRRCGGISGGLTAIMDRIAAWIGAGDQARLEDADDLRASIDAEQPELDAASSWNTIMLSGVLTRLRDLVNVCHDIKALKREIAAGSPRLPPLAVGQGENWHAGSHRDHFMALYSAAAAIVAIGLLCAYWIASAWPEGGSAAALGATGCAFFAAQDDPAPSLVAFNRANVIAIVLDAILLFAVLPMVNDFATLVLVMAPPFLLLSLLSTVPATARAAGPISFLAATELALSSSYSADFASYVNGSLAAVAGIWMVTVVIRVIRSVGAEWTAGRLLRANRRDIAAAATGRHPAGRLAFTTLNMDRLSLVVPRIATAAEGADAASVRAMADLRVGVNVVEMRHDAHRFEPDTHRAIDLMLHDLADYYLRPNREAPPQALLHRIDAAISGVTDAPATDIRDPLLRLVGIRQALFPTAPPYRPAQQPGPLPIPHREAA